MGCLFGKQKVENSSPASSAHAPTAAKETPAARVAKQDDQQPVVADSSHSEPAQAHPRTPEVDPVVHLPTAQDPESDEGRSVPAPPEPSDSVQMAADAQSDPLETDQVDGSDSNWTVRPLELVRESVIGRGGAGTVVRARDSETGRVVAIKVRSTHPPFKSVLDEGIGAMRRLFRGEAARCFAPVHTTRGQGPSLCSTG